MTGMKGYRFPRTYADLDAAPWCDGYDPPKGHISADGDHRSIFIDLDWLPDWMKDEHGEQGFSSPGGGSLKDALEQLREVWPNMRPPELGGGGPCGGCQGV